VKSDTCYTDDFFVDYSGKPYNDMTMNGSSGNGGVLVLKVKANIPKSSASGLILIFVRPSDGGILDCASLVISGSELYRVPLTQSYRELFDIIKTASSTYSVKGDFSARLQDYISKHFSTDMVQSILEKIAINDMDSVNDFFNKEIRLILSTGAVEVQSENETIGQGEYIEISVEEEIDRLTVDKKLKRVLKYVARNTSLARTIVEERPDDMAIMSFTFRAKDGSGGAGVILYNMLLKDYYSFHIVLSADHPEVSVADSPVDFYFRIKDIIEAGDDDDRISQMKRTFQSLQKSAVFDLIASRSEANIKKMIYQVLRKFFGEELTLETRSDFMNSLKVDILMQPSDEGASAGEASDRDDGGEQMRIVSVIPVLSPTRGVRISGLAKGDQIQVKIDKEDTFGRQLLYSLNLIDGEMIKPISARVNAVTYSESRGYTLIVKIAKGLFGKAIEEEDVKIKTGDPVIFEERKKSRLSLLIGLIAGIIVLIITILILIR